MITKVACLAALLAPAQQPAPSDPQPRAGAAVATFAAALPPETLLVAMADACGPHAEELRKTDLHRLLDQLPFPSEAKASLDELARRARELTGLDDAQLAALPRNGFALALTGLDAQGPELVLLAGLGDDPAPYRAALERSMKTLGTAATRADHGATKIWTFAPQNALSVSVCVHGAHLVAATTRERLEHTLERLDGKTAASSLRDHPRYREFETMATAEGAPLVLCFARTADLMRVLLPRFAGEHLARIETLVETMRLLRLESVGYTARVAGGRIHDTIRVHFPEPRDGLFGALLGPGTALSPTAAQFVPPGVASFTISHLNLSRVFDDVVQLVSTVEPSAAATIQGALHTLASRSGVDVQQDVLRSFGEQIITLQWPVTGRSVDFALLIEAREAWRLEKSLSKLITALGVPAKPRTWRGVKVYHLTTPQPSSGDPGITVEISPSFAVGQTHLVFATSEDAMRSALTQLEDPAENTQVVRFLSRLPQGVTAASWTDLGQAAKSLIDRLDGAPGVPASATAAAQKVLGAVQGELESYVAMDPGGLTLRTRSGAGNVYALAAAAIVSSIALPSLVESRRSADTASRAATSGDVRALLRRIDEAQVAHRGNTDQAAFTGLDDLVAAGLLEPWEVGRPAGTGLFERDGYLVTVLLPEAVEDRGRFYAAMAWPADKRRGSVLAMTPSRPMLINDVIAASDGIRMVTATDLFLSGRFGTALVPGWREAASLAESAEKSRDEQLMTAILAAEHGGAGPAPKAVLEGLQSEHPRVAARAAYALGKLKATEGVPKLCEVVEQHTDIEVRRHAMAALRAMADPRSVQASLRAVESEDPMLRALAAANLGRLKAVDAVEALVAVASRTGGEVVTDRVAALLALTDIGARDSLLEAAAAVSSDHAELGTALTYMFQTLGPSLGAEDEASVTMAVLTHPSRALRRYAIQRLGQLRDPTTRSALEGRLGSEEDPGLRPLIEVSLQSLRGGAPTDGAGGTPLQLLEQGATRAREIWESTTPQQRTMIYAAGGGGLVLLLSLVLLRGRRRRAHDAEQWAAMTAPSEEFAAETDAEAYGDEQEEWQDGDSYQQDDAYAGAGAGGRYRDEVPGRRR